MGQVRRYIRKGGGVVGTLTNCWSVPMTRCQGSRTARGERESPRVGYRARQVTLTVQVVATFGLDLDMDGLVKAWGGEMVDCRPLTAHPVAMVTKPNQNGTGTASNGKRPHHQKFYPFYPVLPPAVLIYCSYRRAFSYTKEKRKRVGVGGGSMT